MQWFAANWNLSTETLKEEIELGFMEKGVIENRGFAKLMEIFSHNQSIRILTRAQNTRFLFVLPFHR